MESCYLENNMDKLQSHYTKWSKSEKENMHSIYSWNYLKETHTQNQVHKYKYQTGGRQRWGDGRWEKSVKGVKRYKVPVIKINVIRI